MPTQDLDDPRVKLMRKWSQEMPDVARGALGAKGAQGDDDDEDEDDSRSVRSSYSTQSRTSASSGFIAGNGRFSRTRRAPRPGVMHVVHTHKKGHQQTMVLQPQTQHGGQVVQGNGRRRGKGKKAKGPKGPKGPKVSEVYLPNKGWTEINKSNALNYIKQGVTNIKEVSQDVLTVMADARNLIDGRSFEDVSSDITNIPSSGWSQQLAYYNAGIGHISTLYAMQYIENNKKDSKWIEYLRGLNLSEDDISSILKAMLEYKFASIELSLHKDNVKKSIKASGSKVKDYVEKNGAKTLEEHLSKDAGYNALKTVKTSQGPLIALITTGIQKLKNPENQGKGQGHAAVDKNPLVHRFKFTEVPID